MGRNVKITEINRPLDVDDGCWGSIGIAISDSTIYRGITVQVTIDVPIKELDKIAKASAMVEAAAREYEREDDGGCCLAGGTV